MTGNGLSATAATAVAGGAAGTRRAGVRIRVRNARVMPVNGANAKGIMKMRTPEEIRNEIDRFRDTGEVDVLVGIAYGLLAEVERLEGELEKKTIESRVYAEQLHERNKLCDRLARERDAAVAGIMRSCHTCKRNPHKCGEFEEKAFGERKGLCNWQWRGTEEEKP